jgi:hypothetical protein
MDSKFRNIHVNLEVMTAFFAVMDLREIGWDGMAWIDLAQDRDWWTALVNTVINIRAP